MHERTELFEQVLLNAVHTYFETWPPTLTDVILLAVVLTILALRRASDIKLRDSKLVFWKVFACP